MFSCRTFGISDLRLTKTFLSFREHPASEVYVTGTFDGWKKTEKLNKVGNHFEKLVKLDDVSQKIDYKVRRPTSIPLYSTSYVRRLRISRPSRPSQYRTRILVPHASASVPALREVSESQKHARLALTQQPGGASRMRSALPMKDAEPTSSDCQS